MSIFFFKLVIPYICLATNSEANSTFFSISSLEKSPSGFIHGGWNSRCLVLRVNQEKGVPHFIFRCKDVLILCVWCPLSKCRWALPFLYSTGYPGVSVRVLGKRRGWFNLRSCQPASGATKSSPLRDCELRVQRCQHFHAILLCLLWVDRWGRLNSLVWPWTTSQWTDSSPLARPLFLDSGTLSKTHTIRNNSWSTAFWSAEKVKMLTLTSPFVAGGTQWVSVEVVFLAL